jgi:hypothetical protein
MENRPKLQTAEYDIPLAKPYNELPEWFNGRLISRLVTKKLPKLAEGPDASIEQLRSSASEKPTDH